ncbi:FxSxx-COOH system tetratricopeptide repeat protein [Nocardia sp. NPDC060249]|uniref:FxSxx-COOH system tetratricopeptide repeat protein n=1 Tax=Nocardia sp. NPDC060249 TaxID=3347082 RepID=UPI003652F2DB
MKWPSRKRSSKPQPITEMFTPASSAPTVSIEAAGDRSIATGGGGFSGIALTGDNARVVQLPAEALRPVAEIDAPPGLANLPGRPLQFVGRDDVLQKLDAVSADTGRVVVHALHGLGGIGKSTLVAHWAATRRNGYVAIRWITADSPAGVEQGLAGFAAALQPGSAQALVAAELAERALQWLATHTGWLLILDNVNDPADIAAVLARAGNGHVVITSRLSTGWQTDTSTVRLDVLEPAESLQLVTDILTAGSPRELDGAADLCAELGHLPLAVEQAAAYLAQNPLTTPRAYLELLTQYPSDMYVHAAVGARPERTIARIWRVTLDRIAAVRPLAVDLLRVLAWYGPNSIPASLLDDLDDPPAVTAAVGVLIAYSLITPDPATATVSVHRLVQAVARTTDPDDPHRTVIAIGNARIRAATALHDALPDWNNPANWPTWRLLLPHIEALTNHTAHGTRITAAILDATAGFLHNQGSSIRAIDLFHHALTDLERILGPEDPETLSSRHNLADAYLSAGRVGDAIILHEQNLTSRERVLGTDHPHTLFSRSSLANTYESAGRVEEAILLHEQNVTDRERILGSDDPHTMLSRHNLAYAYKSAGRVGEAIVLHELNVADSVRVLGPDHPDTLTYRNNLAYAYKSAGRVGEAIVLHELNVADSVRVLGPDHPDTLTARNNLANAYLSAGRVSEAIRSHEQNLADRERVLGPDDPETLVSCNNLANAYKSAGHVDEAIALHRQTLPRRERVLGADHPHTLVSRNNLAYAYEAAGRADEAIALHEQNLADSVRVLGPDHPDTLTSQNNLAYAYLSAGRVGSAIVSHEQNLTNRERVLGADHPHTLISRNNLANAYKTAGRLGEAIALHEQNLADRQRVLGFEDPDTLISRHNLADAYEAAGQTCKAIALHERNLDDAVRVLGPGHLSTVSFRNSLVNAYKSVGRLGEAIAPSSSERGR